MHRELHRISQPFPYERASIQSVSREKAKIALILLPRRIPGSECNRKVSSGSDRINYARTFKRL